MAIQLPSYTTPQGEVKTDVYAKVIGSRYANQGSDDPVLLCAVSIFPSKAASDAGLRPYDEPKEYALSPWAPGGARGQITCVGTSALVDGDAFVLDDGVNPAVTFVFEPNSSTAVVETSTLRRVGFDPGAEATSTADLVTAAVNSTPRDAFFIRAANAGAGVVDLVNVYAKAAGNTATVENVADDGFTVTDMTGGADLIDLAAEVENQLLLHPAFAGGTRV